MIEISIRKESLSDFGSIREVNNQAFNQKQEGELVENLRENPDFVPELSLVASDGNKIIGHILFFPVTIVGEKETILSLSLAPLAVLPQYQKKGVGGALIKEGLRIAKEMGYHSVVVLGHPDYYPKFGFQKASNWSIKEPFGAPDEAMMAMELKDNSLRFGGGMINYPRVYYDAI